MSSRAPVTLAHDLTATDHAVLDDLERFRLLTSHHLQRLHYAGDRTALAAARASNRALGRLRTLGYVATLERRIGGARRGSTGLIWHLTDRGHRLQQRRRSEPARRRRFGEPSRHFVQHTLAIAEVATEIILAARAGDFEVLRLETEPSNWQPLLTGAGAATWLKPDLLVVTASAEFEQHWFLEVDLDTEHLPVIRRQRDAYRRHRGSGRYQDEHGVYPAVLWLAPSTRRVEAIRRVVTDDSVDFDAVRFEELAAHLGRSS